MDKRQWRARAEEQRSRLAIDSEGHRLAVERFLADQVAADGYVVTYDAMAGEVDLGPLIAGHPNPEDRFAVTRTPAQGHTLSVHAVGCPMERHRYGYRQPTADAPVLDDDRIVAVLVPALAFAVDGVRLGRGMGYYDRFLGRLKPGAAFIGITGDYVVDRLPSEPFDVAMTHLATGRGVFPVPLAEADRPAPAGS